jgi:tRNA(Ile)-lysidine synthase
MYIDSLCNKVYSFSKSLLPLHARLLIALSGGPDSIALAAIFLRIRTLLKVQMVAVAHVNHGLRGSESDGDEAFAFNFASSHALPWFSTRLDGKTLHESGVEQWARTERYRFLHEVKQNHGFDYILTGHTADDQAETVLMRLMRGCGMQGAQGILASRADGVVRPLLTVRKGELLGWLADNAIGFREDSTNRDCALKRNWVRHELMATIDAHEPGAIGNLATHALLMQHAGVGEEKLRNNWARSYVLRSMPHQVELVAAGMDAPHAEAGLVALLGSLQIEFSSRTIALIADFARRSQSGKRLLLEYPWQCRREKDLVVIEHRQAAGGAEGGFCFALAVPGVSECLPYARLSSELVAGDGSTIQFDGSHLVAYLNAAVLGDKKLVFRCREAGDVIHLAGRERPVAVGTFLKKQGLSALQRRQQGVVALESGEVVWIPGLRADARFAVDSRTTLMVRVACRLLNGNEILVP